VCDCGRIENNGFKMIGDRVYWRDVTQNIVEKGHYFIVFSDTGLKRGGHLIVKSNMCEHRIK